MNKIILLIISLFVVSSSFAWECTQNTGKLPCTQALPPEFITDWIYRSGTNQTPPSGRGDLEDAVQDFFKANEQTNNWSLESVGSFQIDGTLPLQTHPYLGTTEESMTLSGPYVHYNHNPPSTTQWSWGAFSRNRDYLDWRCPAGKVRVDMQPSGNTPPFYCKDEPQNEVPPPIRSCPVEKEQVGNPCSITTGNKSQVENDWIAPNGLLRVQRTYNSSIRASTDNLSLGSQWTHSYSQQLKLWEYAIYWPNYEGLKLNALAQEQITSQDYIVGTLSRSNGGVVDIGSGYSDITITGSQISSRFFMDRDNSLKLTHESSGNWRIDYLKTGRKEFYNVSGRLVRITERNGTFIDLTYISGRLDKVTDNYGYFLKYNYDVNNRISSIILPNNKQITYTYDLQGRLKTVTRPSIGTKIYHYSESAYIDPASANQFLLTGITDERGIRYANFAYDSQDRGRLTEHAGGAQKYTLLHSDTATTVIDPNDVEWTYDKEWVSGMPRVTSAKRLGVTQSQNKYDTGGNITEKIEFGRKTTYTYDLARNLETSRTEAAGTADARKNVTEWHLTLPVAKTVTEYKKNTAYSGPETDDEAFIPVRETSYTHDANGNALTKTIKDLMSTKLVNGVVTQTKEARTWTYTYNQFGQKLTEKTPANETTTYNYNTTNGNLLTVTNPLGQVTTYSGHNADGQPTVITYPNGHKSTITYDDAGRVVQEVQTIYNPTMTGPGSTDGNGQNWVSWPQWLVDLINAWCQLVGWNSPFNSNNQTPTGSAYATLSYPAQQTATTQYVYEFGLLKKVILPDGEELVYTYDDAQRLVGVMDGYGNSTTYVLNANGDITSTEVKDSSNTLQQKIVQTYDNLGRLKEAIGQSTNSQTVTNAYDDFDNLKTATDNRSRTSSSDYDAFNRKVKDTDPLNNQVQYEYDVLDQMKRVIDAKGNSTDYTYNAFGEVTQQVSPDTGISTYRYDDGRLGRMVDGRNKGHNYFYDNAGRMTSRQDGTTTNVTSYSYDQGSYGAGQLTGVSNANSEVRYTKDSAGRVLEKLVAVKPNSPLRVRYRYTAGGKLEYMILPSGRLVRYQYSNGKLTGMLVNGQFISNVVYGAYGVQGWTWGSNQGTVNYQYDLDGHPLNINASNVFARSYVFDNGNRITSITDTLAGIGTQTYEHDTLDRLTKQILSGTTLEYAYADANSNRTSKTTTPAGGTASTVNYTIDNQSNRILSENGVTYGYTPGSGTPAGGGQITSDGVRTYTYDNEGRSDRITKNSLSIVNTYDPLGQRIKKAVGTQFITYVYNEDGQLIGEYDTNNVMLREYIWQGDRLVGMQSSQYPNQVLRVNTDHLGTVRAVSLPNASNTVLWRWEGDQFGDVLPNEDVDANGQILTMPLRHPGQYYDAEVGTFYNYFRDYNPATGRYVESDPIGLQGGMNTYGYVRGKPLSFIDSKGLVEWSGTVLSASAVVFAKDIFVLTSKCVNGKQGHVRVDAKGFTVGFGIPVAYNGGTITFEDGLTNVNLQVFNGQYLKFSAGIAGGIGVGSAIIKLGGATSSLQGLKPALIAGFDLSVGVAGGTSTVDNSSSWVRDCSCKAD